MSGTRANLGFSDELDSFNPEEWTPRKKQPAPETTQAAREAAAKAVSRAASPSMAAEPPKPSQRRRRTGRNAQFNIKAKPETIEAFCAVADAQGWGLGETLEYAVALLKRDYAADGNKG